MSARAQPEKSNAAAALGVIRLSGGRLMRLVQRPRRRVSRLLATLLASWIPFFSYALDPNALPTQGSVQVGSGQISQSGNAMVVTQGSARLGVDWQSFNIGANGSVTFVQPGRDAVALNRVVGNDASQIFGRLTANGQVFLVNPNGVLFAPGSKVDVGGLVASSLNLSQEDFKSGKYQFVGLDGSAKVSNQGDIQAATGGYVALFAPQVSNQGSINVPVGQVVLGGGRAVTVDITGSGLISAVITQGAAGSSVDNSGTLSAPGGSVRMSAKTAQDTVGGLVNNSGVIKASSLVHQNGEIWLLGDSVSNTGEVRAEGTASQAGGLIQIEAAAVALGGTLSVDGASGGQIQVEAGQRLSLADQVSARGLSGQGGRVVYASGGGVLESSTSYTHASGATEGGEIQVTAASGVSSSGHYYVAGATGRGGRIDVTGSSLYLLSAELDASGALGGGRVRLGGAFQGGKTPDAPASADEANHLFVRRWEDSAALANADSSFINDGTVLNLSSSQGVGGTAIVWSNRQTTFLGAIDARGAAGGGAVEISAGDNLRHAALDRVQVGSGGHLLLDPKNLVIGNADALKQWQYQAVLESVYAWKASVPVLGNYDSLGYAVALGSDARLMAVGAVGDDGAAGNLADAGAVHLFAFQDGAFGSGALVGSMGAGYLGGKNVAVALDAGDQFGSAVALNASGQLLAVGARYDDGATNINSNAGAVHLFSFVDTGFGAGLRVGTLGRGYAGAGDLSVSLRNSDNFGAAVALSGDARRMAVGAPLDDGVSGTRYDAGAVHLFSFGAGFSSAAKVGTVGSDYAGAGNLALAGNNYDHFGAAVALSRDATVLAAGAAYGDAATTASGDYGRAHLFTLDTAFLPSLVGNIGVGYTGANDINLALGSGDRLGSALALNGDGTRLAVGAPLDDGFDNSTSDTGAVYLFTFGATGFRTGSLASTLGAGYGGANQVDVALSNNDYFGSSVALSGDALHLAAGAYGDDGAKRTAYDSGAVHLFSFADTGFGAGTLLGSVGQDYRNDRGVGVALDAVRSAGNDHAGTAVSLNSNARLLAVGAPGDDGYGDGTPNAGAVHLISFADGNFGGAALVGSLGQGYTGGSNVAVAVGNSDEFGAAVALSGDGLRLAVGARLDDGANSNSSDAGAVYLFSFANSSFGAGQQVATIGVGYSGANDINLALGSSSYFGQSLALNADGTRLAVGAPSYYNYGAVHLFTFGSGFTAGALVGSMGQASSYTLAANPNNVPLALGYYDQFGSAVALSADGTRLAVGAMGDYGAANTGYSAGAVHLFTFGAGFTSASRVGKIGLGYSGSGSLDMALGNYDNFGAALALSADATLLAVGTPNDDGALNQRNDSGAVHLFTFADSSFGGGALAGTVGDGYSGARHVDMRLDTSDRFGSAVALSAQGERMVVGAPLDDGASNTAADAGAVHLFSFSDSAFGGGMLAGHIGNGYQSSSGLSLELYSNKYWNGDQAASAVALSADARQLVVGVPYDDGSLERPWANRNYGAVHLIGFADGNFGGAALVGSLGQGYSGGKNIDVALDADDNFGAAVALSGDGRRLAVGAPADDGAGNLGSSGSGAVRLFAFDDSAFTNGQLRATLGQGYAGVNDRNPSLSPNYNDGFGSAVALNADGTHLAVGSGNDSGYTYAYGSGAVRLFTFNSDLSGGAQVATIGNGYTTAQDVDNIAVSLSNNSFFGQSVALNAAGTLLAVGAPGDPGFGASANGSGAVRLFSFGAGFTGGAQVATLGAGYVGTQDLNLPLLSGNNFGRAVALNAAGTQLAVGVPRDNGANNDRYRSGAVQLFTFADTAFGGAALAGTLGSGYSGGKSLESGAGEGDQFGFAVALNGAGDRLAVGAPLDDGADSSRTDAGAVHLFSFADGVFAGGRTAGRIGAGYRAQTSLALNLQGSRSWSGDQAGSAVALSSDATQMAIGSPYDDAGNQQPSFGGDYGSVQLVTFADGNFGGAALAGTLGRGYSGGQNLAVALDAYDHFGSAVALSGDGRHLAVGAPDDGGYNNSYGSSGAVHLFTFADSRFGGGQKQATVGLNYSGANNVNVAITFSDNFGSGVALSSDGTRLAVGARYNLGYNGSSYYSGAVHLFTFANGSFGGGQRVGTIGSGYSASGDVNVALDGSDYFGWSVALSADASALAVGAPQDRGFNNLGGSYSGAVHLFSFADTRFGSGQKVGTLGAGYTGSGDVSVALRSRDNFGSAVALSADASKLVVGAPYDSGATGGFTYAGAVRSFSFGAGFAAGAQVGTLGSGYTAANDLNLSASNPSYGYFGSALALNGDATRLAVGVPLDDGATGGLSDAGAVQLFTLGAGLTAPAKVGSIGSGYSGAASLDAPFTGGGNAYTGSSAFGNQVGDQFGAAVALSADARLLALGAPGDVGGVLQQPLAGAGAVHLVSFADGNFGGAAFAGTLGRGYSGGRNLNVNLASGDQFGAGLALSGDGRQLAVGAPGDDGANNLTADAGAVHLFSFADNAFGSAQKTGTLGAGYVGSGDGTVNLVAASYFGTALALNSSATRLAVGAPSSSNYGAVHLFTFGSGFGGVSQIGSIGRSSVYSQAADADNLPLTLDYYDQFGSAVALSGDGRLLAVGAVGDYGVDNSVGAAGAVHLFTFGDGFVSGSRVGIIGQGYSGAGSLAVELDGGDSLGSALALSADGTRLAAGAYRADGGAQGLSNSGAVQLFGFSDTLFGGAQKLATVGAGYSGAKDVNLGLDASDHFGRALALSADGRRLVVGAPGDNGANNEVSDSGAAHLFGFADGDFGGGQRLATIGQAYVAVPQALDLGFVGSGSGAGDHFGSAVALSANARQLAVGSPDNVGIDKSRLLASQGAVSLITFADGDFGGAQLAATIGSGYSGGKNLNLALDAYDDLGASVALSRDGLALAVGAPGDDGAGNSRRDAGAVHLFTFADASFGGGQKAATVGYGYSGGNNLNLLLEADDGFGQGLALNADGTRLAVGAPLDDGFNNAAYNTGSVHLLGFAPGFAAGSQTGTLGMGYVGSGDVDLALGRDEQFGWSLALSGDARLLAVGAPQDSGRANTLSYAGAVHLYRFGDAFAAGTPVATLGLGYTAVNDLSLDLRAYANFGRSVALSTDGRALAVGTPGDRGAFGTRSANGAIQLFTLGTDFTGASRSGTIGADYSGAKDIHFVNTSGYDSELGVSVALSGDASRLAAGLVHNAGQSDTRSDAGAVKLFGFSDSRFSDGRVAGTLGFGYQSAGSALALPWAGAASYSGDAFGSAVAMDASGNLLAVGAPGDDGWRNGSSGTGAVYLFGFGGTGNTQASLLATLGWGYSGGKNLAVALDAGDAFGSAVSLNASGSVLAVGAPLDDGLANRLTDAGAVYLFGFANSAFGTGSLSATLGAGYSGSGSLAVSGLDYLDHFGSAVALSADASLLAVGAPLDKGAANSYVSATAGYGAVHLFKASSGAWSKSGTLGFGYSGAGSLDLGSSLNTTDGLGSSLAMSADGSQLAAGARNGSGFNNQMYFSGEVHLFTFAPELATPAKVGTLGFGYVANLADTDTTNDRNLDVSTLTSYDSFGGALALSADGQRLAVGTPGDDGGSNALYDSGAVHLFSFDGSGFASPARLASVGAGYSAVGDLQNKLASSDSFGSAVAFNADGTRLAVGIPYDNGLANNKTQAGAVRVFTFADSSYAQGFEITALGDGRQPSHTSFPSVTTNDQFGAAVALSADTRRLAVGAPGDDGLANDRADAGAVHLFSFADSQFGGAQLEGSVGFGYSGGKNVSLELGWGDAFGSAVALDATATRMAVGAPRDDGAGNDRQDAGAVHLFGFADGSFGAGSKTGSVGYGYRGAGDLNLASLDTLDAFGSAVALSANGQRLAVGTPGDDGATQASTDAGALHLFAFADGNFGGATLAGRMGSGYRGAGDLDLDLGLDAGDNLGAAVALSGDASVLAAGAPGDDGYNNASTYPYYGYGTGAVHLFGFADSGFGTPAQIGSVGLAYAGAGDTPVPLDYNDRFGSAVALSADARVLAAGAAFDNGADNSKSRSGAAYLFTFADSVFGGGQLGNTLGVAYTSVGQVPVPLNNNDYFGSALALNAAGDRLVVGAPGHDRSGGYTLTDTGTVYLFEASTLSPEADLAALGFGSSASSTAAVSISDLAATLASGTSVSLQANNDLLLADSLLVGGSSGGNLSLQAGRRVLLGGDISTANGSLSIRANAPLADGVVNAERDSGAAVITMGSGRSLDTGSASLRLTLASGAGLTYSSSGDITLGTLKGAAITVENLGPTAGSNIVLNGQLSSSGDTVLATTAGNLRNNFGATALASAGRWLVYTGDWSSSVENGLAGAAGGSMPRLYNQTYALNPPATVAAGNHLIYRAQPTATVYAYNASKVYGAADPTLTYYAGGLVNDDGVADTFLTAGFSAPTLSLPTLADPLYRAVGSYAISVAYTQSGSNAGYLVNAGNSGANLSVTAKPLSLSGLAVSSKTYDGSSSASIASLGTVDGVLAGDAVVLNSSAASASFSDAHAAAAKSVRITGLSLSGSAAGNYSVTNLFTLADINRKTVTLNSITALDKTYDGGVGASVNSYGTLSGLVGSETLAVGGGSARFADRNAGSAKTVTLTSAILGNGSGLASDYVLSGNLPSTTATIVQKALGANGTRVYDGSSTVQAASLNLLGTVGGDSVGLQGTGSLLSKSVGTAKTVSLGTLAVAGSDAGNYLLGSASLDITPLQLAVGGMQVQNRVYDGSTTAFYTGTPTLAGSLLANDAASLDIGSLAVSFADKNAGNNKALVATGLTLTGADAANYRIVVADTASIAPRALSVTASAQNKVYDGSRAASLAYSDNRLGGDVLTVLGAALFDNKNVGSGKTVSASLSLGGTDAPNYLLAEGVATASANITARALTVTGTAQDKVYDRSTSAAVTFTDNRIAGDAIALSALADFADLHVGSNKAVDGVLLVGGQDAGNYSFNTALQLSASITPRLLQASGARVYDGTAAVLAGDLALANAIAGDSLSLGGSASMADKNVGLNKAVTGGSLALGGASAGDYSLDSVRMDITPLLLTVSGLSAQDKVYDGTKSALASGTAVLSGGVLAGDAVSILPTPTITVEFADKNAGQNKQLLVAGGLITGADAGNYQVQVQGTANIAQRNLALAAVAQDKVYDGSRNAALQVSDNRVAGDALAIAASGLFADKNVGADKAVAVDLSVSGLDAPNYAYTPVTSSSASITPRALDVTATAASRIYDGSTLAALTLGDSRISGDALSVTGVGRFADKNVGTAKPVQVTLSLGGADLGNYSYSSSLATSADISVRALDFSSLTVMDKVYDGLLTASFSGNFSLSAGLVAGDAVSADVSQALARFADKHAGANKAVSVSGVVLAGADSANYRVASSVGTASIFKKTVDVRGLTPESRVYDGTTNATVAGTADVSADFISGDSVALNTGNFTVEFADKQVGSDKALRVTGNLLSGADAGNYDPLLNTTASITARTLVVGATAASKTYDGSTAASVTLSDNRVAGDLLSLSDSAAFADKNAGANKTVHITGLALGGTDAGNYVLAASALQTTASIAPKLLTASGSKVYDGLTTLTPSSLAYAGVITGDTLALDGTLALADKNVGTAKAFNGPLLLAGSDAPNYILSGLRYDVSPKTLTVAGLNVGNKVYDGSTLATAVGTPSIELGLVAGDDVSADLSAVQFAFLDKNAGLGKTVQVTGNVLSGLDAANYRTLLSATADITPRLLTVTGVGAEDKVYDGSTTATRLASGAAALSGSIVSGDAFSVDLSNLSVAFADKNAGAAKALVVSGASFGGADAGNYRVLIPDATATISQRPLAFTAQDKVYDATLAASVSDDRLAGDSLRLTASASFASKNAGLARVVNITGISLGGTDAANYSVAATALASANIAPKLITASGSKVYDGLTTLTPSSLAYAGLIAGDTLALDGTLALADKHVGTAKAFNGALLLAGTDGPNYSLSGLRYDVSPKTLTVTGLIVGSKVYDGSTLATAVGTPSIGLELVAGDDVSADLGAVQFAFLDKNAGLGKTVQVTGNVLSGVDAANYRTLLSATADITPRLLTVTGVGAEDKVYDGTTTATRLTSGAAALSGSIVSGDDFSVDLGNLAVAFADKNAGAAKALVVSGASVGGTDAGNYRLTIPQATASIGQRDLHITAASKVYDGSLAASLLDDRISGDVLAISGSARFADVHAALAKSVQFSALQATGSDAGNYRLVSAGSGQADIRARPLSVTVSNVVRLAGEPDPNPFTYSSGAGERIAGDDPVAIAPPALSAAATGGEVFRLQATLTNSDYALSSATDGYLLVLPQPADLAVDNQAQARNVLAVEVDPQLLAQAAEEQQLQQSELLAHAGAEPARVGAPAAQSGEAEAEQVARLMRQIAQDRLGESATVLTALRGQPVLLWSAGQVQQLLQPTPSQ